MKILFVILMFLNSRIINAANFENNDISYLENAIRHGLIEETLTATNILGIDAFDERTGLTAAMLAVHYRKMDILEALIRNGADLRIKDRNLQQDTAKRKRKRAKTEEEQVMPQYLNEYLIAACWGRSEKLVSYFLDNKADINARDGNNNNMTPLIIATKQNDIPLIKLLIARGADDSLRDSSSKGLNSYAERRSGMWDFVSNLVADRDASEKFIGLEDLVRKLYTHLNPVMHIVLEYSEASSMPQMLDEVMKKIIAEEINRAQALKIEELAAKINLLQEELQLNP